jgi:hypothetical protein
VSNSVFLLFPFFRRLFVVLAVAIFLHYALNNGFFAKPGNKLVIAFSLFLFKYEHFLFKNRLLLNEIAHCVFLSGGILSV